MRKPRDFDAEMKALNDRARQLKERKVHQLGELVIASGADTLSIEHLAGALLSITDAKDAVTKEAWRVRGAAFFQSGTRSATGGNRSNTGSDQASNGSTKSTAGEAGAQ